MALPHVKDINEKLNILTNTLYILGGRELLNELDNIILTKGELTVSDPVFERWTIIKVPSGE